MKLTKGDILYTLELRRIAVLASAAVSVLALTGGRAVDSSQSGLVAKAGNPAMPSGARAFGLIDGKSQVRFSVLLAPRDPTGLRSYADQVSLPGSPLFHRFLGRGEVQARFGPSPDSESAVGSWLAAAHLVGSAPTGDGMVVPVRGTAAAVNAALHVSLMQYRAPDGRVAMAEAASPSVPAALGPIISGVVGLDGFVRDAPQVRRLNVGHRLGAQPGIAGRSHTTTAGGPSPCQAATNAASAHNGYTSDQLASAYGFTAAYGAGHLGAGMTVGLYELADYSDADIATFNTCYGIAPTVVRIPVDGGAGIDRQGSGEVELDLNVAESLAPKASFITYEAPNSDGPIVDLWARIAGDDAAQVISTSWGSCEAETPPAMVQADNTLFQAMAAQGQSVLAASGDSGSESCSQSILGDQTLSTDDPASQPYVTGVGGTTLAAGGPPNEHVWNRGISTGEGAGGGGRSTLWSIPSWQPSVVGGNGARQVPDVSALADPVGGYVVYCGVAVCGPGWTVRGGTSAAAPLWAAFIAVSERQLGFLNPLLYHLEAADPSTFNDITVGNNDYLGVNGGQYPARPGYDMATGLGSPDGVRLLAALDAVGPPSAVTSAPTSVTSTSADLNGSANPDGAAATITFQYGTTQVYGSTTPTQRLAAGLASLPVRSAVSGLAPGTTYHYRLAVSTTAGTAAGADQTFTTTPVCKGQTNQTVAGQPWVMAAMTAVTGCPGYWVATEQGQITAFGGATSFGDMAGQHLNAPVVGMAVTPDHGGYWLLGADGGIFTFGDARFFGSTGKMHLNAPVVAMASTANGNGYWIVAKDGGIFTFGGAVFHGSTGAIRLAKPVVGMAATPAGTGYWLAAADGGIFSFNAPFLGSLGAVRLNRPVVGMTADPAGRGYRMVASDGGIFSFGAPFYGSLGATPPAAPVTTMAPSVDGNGYYMVGTDGAVYAFGDAPFLGRLNIGT